MLMNPRVGQRVQVWYRAALRGYMPCHGRVGAVVVPCRGRPRNHGVLLDGETVARAVPCGNLRPEPEPSAQAELF